jgi:PII-like signaling protein
MSLRPANVQMTEPVVVLLIFVNEADLWRDIPLYEAIVKRLRELGVAGAMAQSGLMGFGHHHLVHERGLFGLAADRPVVITVVDTERKIREVIPEVRVLVREGLILLLPGELVPLDAGGNAGN